MLTGENVLQQSPVSRRIAVDDPTVPLPRKRKKRKKVVRGNPPIPGMLYLTNQRLVHVPAKGDDMLFVTHTEIEDIEFSNVTKSMINVLTIDLFNGDAYDFMYEGHPEWKMVFPTVINRSKSGEVV